jgi:hypothetical protein
MLNKSPKRSQKMQINKSVKPLWQRLIESSGGTALITVLLGGIVGQCINLSIQKGLKEREFQQQWMKARGDQALASYNQYLSQENELVQKSYEIIGNCIATSDDLITLTTPHFAPGSHEDIEAQRTEIRIRYNAVDSQWRTEREKLGLLMSYYHHTQPEVVKAWADVQESVTNYMKCAEDWYRSHEQSAGDISHACEKEKKVLKARLVILTNSLEASRRYAWEGWETPEKLRSALNEEK